MSNDTPADTIYRKITSGYYDVYHLPIRSNPGYFHRYLVHDGEVADSVKHYKIAWEEFDREYVEDAEELPECIREHWSYLSGGGAR